MIRGLLAGAMTLIVLQVASTDRGFVGATKGMQWINAGIKKAGDPKIAAIPYVNPPAKAKKPTKPGTTPQQPNESGGYDTGLTLPTNPTFVNV